MDFSIDKETSNHITGAVVNSEVYFIRPRRNTLLLYVCTLSKASRQLVRSNGKFYVAARTRPVNVAYRGSVTF